MLWRFLRLYGEARRGVPSDHSLGGDTVRIMDIADSSRPSDALSRLRVLTLALIIASLVVVLVARQAGGQVADTVIDQDEDGVEYVSGELIVTYEEDVSEAPVQSLTSEVEGVVEETLPAVDSQVVSFPEVVDEPEGAEREEVLEGKRQELESDPAVASADYNYLRKTSEAPNDPFYSRQTNLEKIRTPDAWTSSTSFKTQSKASIAVIDTGADLDHPDLRGKIVKTTNTANPLMNANDTDGHGTHVAGIAAAATNNGRGVAGVCPDCGLMIAKAESKEGFITGDAVIKAINWATNNDAEVINISLAGEGAIEAEREAVERAAAAGAVVVAAAGNESSSVRNYPAAYDDALAVSATTLDDRRASYSNYGGWIDLAAPGGAYSAIPNGYGTKTGTSMSSPTVGGVAGLLADSGLGKKDIESRLISTAVDLGPSGRDGSFGYGRVDAAKALSPDTGGSAGASRTDNTAPTVSNPNPRPGVRTKGRAVTIAATVRDRQTNLAKSNIALFVDGRRKGFNYNRSTDRLKRKMTFAPGRHRVKVVVRDGQGLSRTATWSFSVPRANPSSGTRTRAGGTFDDFLPGFHEDISGLIRVLTTPPDDDNRAGIAATV